MQFGLRPKHMRCEMFGHLDESLGVHEGLLLGLRGAAGAVPAAVGISGQDTQLTAVPILGTVCHIQLDHFSSGAHIQLPLQRHSTKSFFEPLI